MRVKHILSILFYFLPAVLFAQQDDWEVYIARYEKGVGSTVINMSAKTYAPKKDLPYLLVTGVTFGDCMSDGMPTRKQFAELYSISDSVKALINRETESILVGTFTYQCERLDYYYLKDTTSLRQYLLHTYQKCFKTYQPYVNLKEDRKWEAYLTFLYPNEETFEFMQNQKVLSKLEEAGDKLDKARLVDHWIYFASEVDRDCFINYVSKLQFKIILKEKTNDLARPYKLQISRTDKVNLTEISNITLDLRKQAQKCNGDYDGWETVVVK